MICPVCSDPVELSESFDDRWDGQYICSTCNRMYPLWKKEHIMDGIDLKHFHKQYPTVEHIEALLESMKVAGLVTPYEDGDGELCYKLTAEGWEYIEYGLE